MGKLSLYKSKQYFKRKHRKVTSGRPSKIFKFSNRNKDIDTTWSYSDNCENESKVLMHKRAGVPDAFNPMEPS